MTIDDDGLLVPRASKVSDYVCRGTALAEMSLWEYTARVKKECVKCKTYTRYNDSDSLSDEEGCEPDTVTDICFAMGELKDGDWTSLDAMLDDVRRKRPKFQFAEGHVERKTHFQMVVPPKSRRVPVPLGASIPRRDHEEVYSRYCRLMLLLFVPWNLAQDLRKVGQSWCDAFVEFRTSAPTSILKVMDNMQILHECRDSRDDHFANRCIRVPGNQFLGFGGGSSYDDDFDSDENTDEAILHHLQSLDQSMGERFVFEQGNVRDTLKHADAIGIFRINHRVPPTLSNDAGSGFEECVKEARPELESIWDDEYEARRSALRTSAMVSESDGHQHSKGKESTVSGAATMNDGSAFREAFQNPMTLLPSIRQDIPATDADREVNIEAIISEYTLSLEQERAFRIIAEHSMLLKPGPLRMFLNGPGGTGKSRVINALTDFLQRRNQSRRFRLCSYTGVAAKNITGMTLHSALLLNHRAKKGVVTQTNHDLISMWQGVDYMFIDEASMVGSKLLVQINNALCRAKEEQSAFGGVSIIFAGDFAQLPPVGDSQLFSRVRTLSGSEAVQKHVQGKLLWFSVDVVVILQQVMRQDGKSNNSFVALLG